MNNVYIYIFGMALVTYAIRVLPLTLIRKKIENRVIRSFLYYVPYVTLAVMTFPAILDATQYQTAAVVALVVAIVFAYFGKSLFFVAISSSVTVFVLELVIKLLTT